MTRAKNQRPRKPREGSLAFEQAVQIEALQRDCDRLQGEIRKRDLAIDRRRNEAVRDLYFVEAVVSLAEAAADLFRAGFREEAVDCHRALRKVREAYLKTRVTHDHAAAAAS